MVIYVTTTVKKVIGEFDVQGIITERLDILWNRTSKYAGIEKDIFFNYFNGLRKGYAIEIGEIRQYDNPFCPAKEFGIKPPQSFMYIEPEAILE